MHLCLCGICSCDNMAVTLDLLSGHPIRRARMDGTSWCLIIPLQKTPEFMKVMGLKMDFHCHHCPLEDSSTTMPELLSHHGLCWVYQSISISLFPLTLTKITWPNYIYSAKRTNSFTPTISHWLASASFARDYSKIQKIMFVLFGTTSLLGVTSRMSS